MSAHATARQIDRAPIMRKEPVSQQHRKAFLYVVADINGAAAMRRYCRSRFSLARQQTIF